MLDRTFTGNELVSAFNGNTSDAITLITVPSGNFATILQVTMLVYGSTSGTTSYNADDNLYIGRIGQTGYAPDFSTPIITNLFINETADKLGFSFGQPGVSAFTFLSVLGNLGADVALKPSSSGPVNITQGDRTIKLSITYRLTDLS